MASMKRPAKVREISVPMAEPISARPNAPSPTPMAVWISGRRGKMEPMLNE
ncbi:hypothetical protein D3C71_1798570 [compost metagenome]